MWKQHKSRTSLIAGVLAVVVLTPTAVAQDSWTYVDLHPAGAISSSANATTDLQVGNVDWGAGARAVLWSGTPESYVDLHPASAAWSNAWGITDTYQAGDAGVDGAMHAVIWYGSPQTWVDLHPAGADQSRIRDAHGDQQVGVARYAGVEHAVFWSGTPQSVVDLHPAGAAASWAETLASDQQAGNVWVGANKHASIWSGTPESWVDLHPAGAIDSVVRGTSGIQQAGNADFGTGKRASIWNGTPGSWQSLHPIGAESSAAQDTTGSHQAGRATFGGLDRACVWNGTPESSIDLHALLPAHYSSSFARGVFESGGMLYVVGRAWNDAAGRQEATLWIGPADYSWPDPTGACCISESCSIETAADCLSFGGTYLGDGTTCAGNPCGGDAVSFANSDLATPSGMVIAGSYADTWGQDDVYEALQEEQTGGKPSKRKSLLDHVWTFTVNAGTAYTFYVEAHHTANGEGDDFIFSYSLDDSVYTEMLSVTRTFDNDLPEWYVFSADIAGTVYVRVADADRTPGNSGQDILYVDEMYIVTAGAGSDVTPPSAPTGLAATGGDGFVSLDWGDNGEPDLDGYNVWRATVSGGPYMYLDGLLASSDYVDGAVTNGMTYYYVVTAVDTTGNESADSAEAAATPQTAGVATSTHVEFILCTTVNTGGGNKRGQAQIMILDDLGGPVADADVTAMFTGDYSETVVATTGTDGVAVLTTSVTARGGVSFTVCVDGVSHATLTYDENANVVTCASY